MLALLGFRILDCFSAPTVFLYILVGFFPGKALEATTNVLQEQIRSFILEKMESETPSAREIKLINYRNVTHIL